MARATISGLGIEYQLFGKEGDPAVVLTPGGRFPGDTPGMPELAQALAAGGKRVLIWDRPNCGASDIRIDASESEARIHARVLVGLLRELKLGPAALVGGSAGARPSLVTAISSPELVSHVALCWISGGIICQLILAVNYCCQSAIVASQRGMEGVMETPFWAETVRRNPRNHEALLAMDPWEFIRVMERWAEYYLPVKDSPIAGITPAEFAAVKIPTLIFNNGKSDLSHTRATTEWVHKLMPGSRLVDPPWGDNEWNECQQYAHRNGGVGHFHHWPKLAPQLLDFFT